MSVQLLLLRKSIYWSWVYCKITKVKSWIRLVSRALLLLPSSVQGEMCPAHPCSLPPPHHGSSLSWHQQSFPPCLAAHLSPSHCTSPRRPRVQPEKTNSEIKREMANFLFQGFWLSQEPLTCCSLGWGCRIWLRKGLLEAAWVWKHSRGLHVWILCWKVRTCMFKIILWCCVSHSNDQNNQIRRRKKGKVDA